MHRVDYPVDSWVTSNGLVLRINENNFKVLIGRILVDPIGVQYSQVGATATDTFLGR